MCSNDKNRSSMKTPQRKKSEVEKYFTEPMPESVEGTHLLGSAKQDEELHDNENLAERVIENNKAGEKNE